VAFVSAKNKQGIHIAWKTVTYRSVMLAILCARSATTSAGTVAKQPPFRTAS